MMAEPIDEIINKIVQSQAKFAIVKLFKENPYVMDNRFGLSLWVGRPEEMLIPEIEELLAMGVIHRWGTEPGAIYAYTRDKDMRKQIEERWPEISRRASEFKWQQERERTPGSCPGSNGSEGKEG